MDLIYTHRLQYYILLSFAWLTLFYYFDIRELANEYTNKNKDWQRTLTRYQSLTHNAPQNGAQKKPEMSYHIQPQKISATSPVANFYRLLERSRLRIETSQINPISLQNGLAEQTAHVVLRGADNDLYLMLQQLFSSPSLSLITQMKLEPATEHELQITLDIILFYVNVAATLQTKWQQLASPFCGATQKLVTSDKEERKSLMQTTLAEINLVGIVMRGWQRQALLSLPYHLLVSVTLGDMIGKEHAVVTEIKRELLQIRLPDQSIKTLRLLRDN